MVNLNPRKSTMTLFSSSDCAMSHCVRFAMYEKGVSADIEFYDPSEPPEDLLELNPTGVSPTLVERSLVLYDARIIMEYLDERFPHPPLHPMDPVSRAKARMIIKRIDQDWYQLFDEIINSGEKKSARAKKMLKESLLSAEPIFQSQPFFMGDEFSLIDCALVPLLWRLPALGIDLPGEALHNYAQRQFKREGFISSLTGIEKEMGTAVK